jgi:hypothetical protein
MTERKETHAMRATIRPVATAAASLAIIGSLLVPLAAHAQKSVPSPAVSRAAHSLAPSLTCVTDTTPSPDLVQCDLYARSGTTNLPGESALPILGYTDAIATLDRPGGPVITVNEGEDVQITLHNELDEQTALALPGQALPLDQGTDTVGAAAHTSKVYAFRAGRAGTFVYQAGLTPDGASQVARGLYGALVVRPTGAPNQAYNDASTAFDDEFVVVVGGIDPRLNRAVSPGSFDMSTFNPSYWTINGLTYPGTDGSLALPQPPAGGSQVLFRYVNAGLGPESLGAIGLYGRVVGTDATPVVHPYETVAETVPPGATLDAIVTVPHTGSAAKYALGSASGHMFNGTGSAVANGATDALAFGGMLAFIDVAAEILPGSIDTTAPSLAYQALSTATRGLSYTVRTTANDLRTGGSKIAGGEWFIDSDPGKANGQPLSAADGAFDSATEEVVAEVSTQGLMPGRHSLGIRVRDAAHNWSAVTTISIVAPDVLLRDGFESGRLDAWAAVQSPNRLSISAAAALNGGQGLRVSLGGGISAYVVDTSPATLSAYRARFLFHPRSVRSSTPVDLFIGRTATGTAIFRIQIQRSAVGTAQVRVVEKVAGGQRTGRWISIAAGRAHALEIAWKSAARGGATLYIDGVNRGAVTGNTRGLRLEEVRLGAVSGVAKATGRFDIDRFSSSRGGVLIQ